MSEMFAGQPEQSQAWAGDPAARPKQETVLDLKQRIVELQHERNELSKAVALANQKIAELEFGNAEYKKFCETVLAKKEKRIAELEEGTHDA